ncbi:hypothetical protein GGR55DRAFT_529394 [Xylaria sp. FL0064]|nr:hypothetical protein GGR55DRAFT_529394 [Xylaria sp. FL0064]
MQYENLRLLPILKYASRADHGRSLWMRSMEILIGALKLEDLTKNDIKSYVTDEFLAHNQYGKLIQMNLGYSSPVESVVTKSQGVFLWVFLVVRELLEGFKYNDTLNTMRHRLDSFLRTLESVFQHMLDSVSEVCRPQTSRIFQISVSYNGPLPVFYYSYVSDINDF